MPDPVVGSDAQPRDGGQLTPDRKCSRLQSQRPDPSAQNAGVASHPGRPSPTPDSAICRHSGGANRLVESIRRDYLRRE